MYPPIRLLAAEQLGQQGHLVLRALAADAALDIAMRIRAVQGLGRPPVPDLPGSCDVMTACPAPELACAALDGLRPSSTAALDAVLECARSEHESVRTAAARALGRLSQPDSEPALIGLLRDASSDVQQASAEALGLFASVAAVEPLVPLAESLVRPRLRQAARGAIGRIQSRLGQVEAGRVSLAEPHELAGALDVVETSLPPRVGELSLANDEQDAAVTPRRGRRQP